MIEAKNLYKNFDGFEALKGVNCRIEDGCIFGMVGSNGSGKSTFLRHINGVYKPDKGEVLIDGVNVFDNADAKKRIVFVPDELYFIKAADINRMSKLYQSVYDSFDKEYFDKVITALELPKKKSVEKFSKGMKRQAALALALAVRPDYYIFDETFDGLDPMIRTIVKNLIYKEVAERNATVIVTSHSLRELDSFCDHLALLHKGNLILQNDVDSLKTSLFKVQAAFKEEVNAESFPGFTIKELKKAGSVTTIIGQGDIYKFESRVKEIGPIFYDILSLSLDEIFTYEMKTLGYSFDELLED